ncbi:MAG: hypothetical protein R3C53_20645 [Pirellulaceae bacterium]
MAAFGCSFAHRVSCVTLVAAWLLLAPLPVRGQYSPEHPKVKEMVEKGIKYLEAPTKEVMSGDWEDGRTLLVGYTVFKVKGDTEHPLVKPAIATAVRMCDSLPSYRDPGESKIVYEVAMATVLLASADAVKYRPQLDQVVYFYQGIQKPHGGFGYQAKPTGDTSQVQYVMLAMWTLNQVDVDVPVPMIEKTLQYLRATMDPEGSWGYQGKLGQGPQLVKQDAPTKSLATAGIGALLIGSDILSLFGARKQEDEEDDGIPPAFKRIDLLAKARAARRNITMTRSDVDGPITRAISYQNKTPFEHPHWYYYWRYSQERYESFVEIVNGRQEKSPDWYNQGVNEFANLQTAEGAFGLGRRKSTLTDSKIATSFAILFLIRSTQKAIGKLDEGVAFGGYELPLDVSQIKMVGDRIVSDAETSVENLLEMLESDENRVQAGLLPNDLQLTKDPVQRKEQVARLSRLLSSNDFSARRIAAKLLGRSEDLDQVPDLIYALTDNDPEVRLIAEEGLRLLSRKLKSGKLTLEAKPSEIAAAVDFWKQWYLGLRPDYIFIDR